MVIAPIKPRRAQPVNPRGGRLTPDDDLFVRMEHAAQMPVLNQCVWRLTDFDESAFDALAQRLSVGRLSRLVIRRRLPVRDRWRHTPTAGAWLFDDSPIEPEYAEQWARRQCDIPLDSVSGPSWRLSAVRVVDSSDTYVSLVVSHVVGDGGAVMVGVEEAVTHAPYDRHDSPVGPLDEVRDGINLLACAARAGYTIVRTNNRVGADSGPPPAADRGAGEDRVARTDSTGAAPTAIVTIAADAFDEAAQAVGGTANTLFTALALGLLQATGRVADGDDVPVSLPMSTRTPADPRANATSGVGARVVVSPDRYTDLRPIRAASKAAFSNLASGPGPMALLGVLAQPLGDGLVRQLVANARAPLCLASNLGSLSTHFASLGTASAGPVAMRSITTAPTDVLRRMNGGISGWASRSAGVVTLCFTSLDPDRVINDGMLHDLLAAELSRWNLIGNRWGT
ncbi:MAG: hypothetical protein QM673_05285 [Gordonia sp. (in: high G+C Gram-positive bacteria)]